jgi:F0F1-type ATP synthase delta subunit
MAQTSRRPVVSALINMIDNGSTMSDIAQVLAAYLVENHQARQAELYLRDIRRALANRFGHVSVEVQSARQLDQSTERQIAELIKRRTNNDQVETIKTVDNSLIGGVVISTTDDELDASIHRKLQKLRMI